jgi:hypothetical protein
MPGVLKISISSDPGGELTWLKLRYPDKTTIELAFQDDFLELFLDTLFAVGFGPMTHAELASPIVSMQRSNANIQSLN